MSPLRELNMNEHDWVNSIPRHCPKYMCVIIKTL